MVPKAASISLSVLAFTTWSRLWSERAASCISFVLPSAAGLFGLIRKATVPRRRISLPSNSNFFCSTAWVNRLTPVALPPGQFRLATSPDLTTSPPLLKTIGTVEVAAFAAVAA